MTCWNINISINIIDSILAVIGKEGTDVDTVLKANDLGNASAEATTEEAPKEEKTTKKETKEEENNKPED